MKKWAELTGAERANVTDLFTNWLKDYTHKVVIQVLKRKDEILENEFAFNLLCELYDREQKEFKDLTNSINSLLNNYKTFAEYDVHNHPLEHSKSYRDVLYDMYIRDTK